MGAPPVLGSSADVAQSSSYNNLMKNNNKQYESKTPQIKKYLIKRSDTDGVIHINSNQQLTARINQGPLIH